MSIDEHITEPQEQTSVGDVEVAVRTAGNQIRVGEYSAAEALLIRALETNPRHRTARYLLGMARFRAGDFVGAEHAYRALLQYIPEDADAHYGLAVSLIQLGRREEAAAALDAALRARPDFPEASHKLRRLRGSPVVADGQGWLSLAEMLDKRGAEALEDATMAGPIQWAGRPFPISPIYATVVAAGVLLVPPVFRNMAEPMPNGLFRDLLTQLWRLAVAVSVPVAALILAVGVVHWMTTRYTLCERRLEVTRGVLRRRHIVLWFHDIERQAIVEQTLLDQLLGLASIVIVTDAVLLWSRTARQSRLGRLVLRGLPADRAYELGAVIREATLRERRRMLQSFVSQR